MNDAAPCLPAWALPCVVGPSVVKFILPLPPSVNHYKRIGKNRNPYNHPAYTKWKTEAGWCLAAQRVAQKKVTLAVPVAVEMIFMRKGDIDNRIKPLLDLLKDNHVLLDDKYVERLLVTFGDVSGCEVTIEAIG